jgi:hypothetical protein
MQNSIWSAVAISEKSLKFYKEPKVISNDGLNIQTSSPFSSNVGFDSPFTPIA